MSETETINTNSTGATIPVKAVSMSDFEHIEDSIEAESRLIESYNVQLTNIVGEGKLKTYKDTLKSNKVKLTLQKNAYSVIISGKSVSKEYWDDQLYPYLKASRFPITETDFEVRLEAVRKVDKETNEVTLEEVPKVHLTNNLKEAKKHQLPFTIQYILDHFDISSELEASFKEVLESLKSEKEETARKGHVVKANSELVSEAGEKVKNDFNLDLARLEVYLENKTASISFINWKLSRIKVFEGENNIKKLETEKLTIQDKLNKRCKEDKKTASLVSIARKWNL